MAVAPLKFAGSTAAWTRPFRPLQYLEGQEEIRQLVRTALLSLSASSGRLLIRHHGRHMSDCSERKPLFYNPIDSTR
jgi:hypothetical protein